jgi:transaldolase
MEGDSVTTTVIEEVSRAAPEVALQAHERASYDLARGDWKGPAPVAAPADEPAWEELRALAFRLWLDTGDLEEAAALWSRQFSGLTTNNTLVNHEVQTGGFDELIRRAGAEIRSAAPSLPRDELVREVGFVVNCRVALRLIERFDAQVSVELHPALAHDVEASVRFGRRYFAVCPERFFIKLPFTAAGCLATRQLSRRGIPVNFTLGFSTRQNDLAARLARPAYVNVFLGRLNAFVVENKLGSGDNVGEKTVLATQRRLLELRRRGDAALPLLIGASIRSPEQIAAIAGVDVLTIPPKVAMAFREQYRQAPIPLSRQIENDPRVTLTPPHDLSRTGLETLWTLPDAFRRYVDGLTAQDMETLTPEAMIDSAREHRVSLFHPWSPEEWAQLRSDGKIPKFERWADRLADGSLGLDDLMSGAALASFATDQEALDARIRQLLRNEERGTRNEE